MLHLDLESDNHRGDETHTDTEEVVGEVTLVQRQFMVRHTLHHRQNHVKTCTRNTSATTSAVFVKFCVYVSEIVHADMCISTVRDEAVAHISMSLFLTRIVVVEWGSVSVWLCVLFQ